MLKRIKAFAPATVANVSCGFDIMGFPMENIGDTIEMELQAKNGVVISEISGPGNLSKVPEKNVCGVVAIAMLKALNYTEGLNIKLTKGVLPGSGLGSSAASSAVTAFAINELFDKPFTNTQLVEFAMLGEALASGTAHADNVAPAIFGGFVVIRSYSPLDIITLPHPDDLYCSVIHPLVELRTELSRSILKREVDLGTAIKQWGNVAGLTAGLFKSDYDLIGRSLHDYIVEPLRSKLIPAYDEITAAAKNSNALGFGISGSGPSIFALSKGQSNAVKVGDAMSKAAHTAGLPYEIHVSKIAKNACRIIND